MMHAQNDAPAGSAPLPVAGTSDFAPARRMMVLGQITPNGVTDPLLIEAMGRLPREAFVPPAQQHRAYADAPVPLGEGRFMLQPMVLARMIQLLLPQPGERALVLGAGTGYGAALLARMGLEVTAVEADPRLAAVARTTLAAVLPHARPEVIQADPARGHAEGAPYRVMLIEGVAERLPVALTNQLGEGGRLALIRGGEGPVGKGILLRRAGAALGEQWVFETTATALVPEFAAARGFVF